ncbi:DegT/DnrJ/EryC1/StrS family aminotransferase [Kitasatospora sp. NPDC004615]|uniref:DegT/DnrJ/EryC1/StrS family aminotransferase n=1 Tax=Kitasatospora sp. NPDC004615 TaxID=3364017 RepID=UPI0036C8DBC2
MSRVLHVPFTGADREFDDIGHEMMAAIEKVFRSGRVMNGESVPRLEQSLAELSGRRHARVVNSGTDAVYFALVAAGIGPGDEVLLGDISFVATLHAIVRTGATPVFVDVTDEGTIDLDLAEEAVGPRSKALVIVQLYGRMAAPDPVEKFARAHGLALVEDAAQSLGAEVNGRRSGTLGLASCHSFDAMKVIPAPGTGGVVLTDDPAVAESVEQLRHWGFADAEKRHVVRLGHNSQMSSLTAAVLAVKLAQEERWLKQRRATASTYSAGFGDLGCGLPEHGSLRENIFHKYVLRTPKRDELAAALRASGVETLVHYPYALHTLPFLERHPHRVVGDGRAKKHAAEVISLPIHPYLTDEEIAHVVTSTREALLAG